jgi:hypothetical protein
MSGKTVVCDNGTGVFFLIFLFFHTPFFLSCFDVFVADGACASLHYTGASFEHCAFIPQQYLLLDQYASVVFTACGDHDAHTCYYILVCQNWVCWSKLPHCHLPLYGGQTHAPI